MVKEQEIPEEYSMPQPEGFEHLQRHQQDELIQRRNELIDTMEKYGVSFPHVSKQRIASMSLGKYLLRDVPLFKYEMWIYISLIPFAGMMYFFERFEIIPGIGGRIAIILAMIPLAIWIIKKVRYMPTKFKVPWIHCHGSRVIKFGTTDPRKGYIEIGPKDERKRVYLTKLNKHIEESTGLPCVITTDFQGENISIMKDDKPDMRSQEFNAILESLKAVTTKQVMKRFLRFTQVSKTNPIMLLALGTFVLVAILIGLQLMSMGVFE